jgi:hypothetical protein
VSIAGRQCDDEKERERGGWIDSERKPKYRPMPTVHRRQIHATLMLATGSRGTLNEYG